MQSKVLHIIKKTSYDGAAVFPVRIINEIVEYEHELLTVFKGSAHDEIMKMGIKINALMDKGEESLLNKLLKYYKIIIFLRNNKYDIIHYHLGGLGILLLATIFKKSSKIIHHMHSGNIVGNVKSNNLNIFQKSVLLFLKNRNNHIAVANNVKEYYEEHIGNSHHVTVINNFSPFEFKKRNSSLNHGIGFLGRIVNEKGFANYLSIIDPLSKKKNNIKYFIKGDIYNFSNEIELLINNSRLELFKPSFNIKELFKRIDLLIFPSIAPEAFPLVVIEAASFDVGVIALRSKAVNNILGNYPLFIDELSNEALVEKILNYYKDSNLRHELSEYHLNISEKYSKGKAIKLIDNYYKALVS